MTSPVHSGEPETPQTEAGKRLHRRIFGLSDRMPDGAELDALILAIEREAAALTPGAGLDVERLARALKAEAESDRWDDEEVRPMRWSSETLAALIAEKYQALGSTPDPRPEIDR